jgi:hypothetical protein
MTPSYCEAFYEYEKQYFKCSSDSILLFLEVHHAYKPLRDQTNVSYEERPRRVGVQLRTLVVF